MTGAGQFGGEFVEIAVGSEDMTGDGVGQFEGEFVEIVVGGEDMIGGEGDLLEFGDRVVVAGLKGKECSSKIMSRVTITLPFFSRAL